MIRITLLTLMLYFPLMGFAAKFDVSSDYDTAADFDALKTFDWMPATGNAAADELLIKKIRSAMDSQLQAKGRSIAAENPDFLIGMEISGKTTHGGSVGVGLSLGIPVGRHGSLSIGGGRSKAREKTEGTLAIEFVDAKTKSLVWRASVTDAVNPSATAEQRQQKINEVVEAMLEHFPPKKK